MISIQQEKIIEFLMRYNIPYKTYPDGIIFLEDEKLFKVVYHAVSLESQLAKAIEKPSEKEVVLEDVDWEKKRKKFSDDCFNDDGKGLKSPHYVWGWIKENFMKIQDDYYYNMRNYAKDLEAKLGIFPNERK